LENVVGFIVFIFIANTCKFWKNNSPHGKNFTIFNNSGFIAFNIEIIFNAKRE